MLVTTLSITFNEIQYIIINLLLLGGENISILFSIKWSDDDTIATYRRIDILAIVVICNREISVDEDIGNYSVY